MPTPKTMFIAALCLAACSGHVAEPAPVEAPEEETKLPAAPSPSATEERPAPPEPEPFVDAGDIMRCRTSNDCGRWDYCAKPLGHCGGAGVCRPRGITLFCPTRQNPVCGCDGRTYENECLAHKARASLRHRGECRLPPREGEE